MDVEIIDEERFLWVYFILLDGCLFKIVGIYFRLVWE